METLTEGDDELDVSIDLRMQLRIALEKILLQSLEILPGAASMTMSAPAKSWSPAAAETEWKQALGLLGAQACP